MVDLITIKEPFYIFPIVSIITSSITTSKRWLFLINLTVLLIFCFFFLYVDVYLIDIWIVFILTILIIINSLRAKLTKYFSSGSNVTFEAVEKYIYDRDFKLLFNEEEFKLLFNTAVMKKTKERIELSKEGENFERVFYLATIPSYKSVILKAKNTTISYLHEGAWLGN